MGQLQVQLTANLVAGPASVSDSFFPSGSKTIPFTLNQVPKQYAIDVGNVLNLNSPNAPQSVPTIGGEVTQATTLYLRVQNQMYVSMTFANPGGGADIVVTGMPLYGVLLLETPQGGYLKALSIQGSGQVEYWAAGLS